MADVDSELYHEDQQVLTCQVCACRYPATRRRLIGEVVSVPVCTDRCRSILEARAAEADAPARA